MTDITLQIPFDNAEENAKFDGRKKVLLNNSCRNCIHRQRYLLNEYSSKVIQCCDLQKSRRSNSGYKTIKVTDKACLCYKEKTTK